MTVFEVANVLEKSDNGKASAHSDPGISNSKTY